MIVIAHRGASAYAPENTDDFPDRLIQRLGRAPGGDQ
jgi:hypothetical protein